MNWSDAHSLMLDLESCFKRIQRERMQDVPILNPKLQVKAIDFLMFQQAWLGILITPWFMNILYFRDDEQGLGSKITHTFPAGQIEFIVAFEEALGFYQSCSLYSPMFAFADQLSAEQTAIAAMRELVQISSTPEISRRDLLRGRFSKRP